mmetsp:Transcript_64794/g.159485  ORF Transcript_64794/g.159485 Transcript_64794/m.159485 type:complete len:87 (+) Transcript_64794:274-534(+)
MSPVILLFASKAMHETYNVYSSARDSEKDAFHGIVATSTSQYSYSGVEESRLFILASCDWLLPSSGHIRIGGNGNVISEELLHKSM